jgi:hypothetical protein
VVELLSGFITFFHMPGNVCINGEIQLARGIFKSIQDPF